MSRLPLVVLACLLPALPVPGPARADDDETAIERALERGTIAPLQRLLERVETDFGGRVLTVELEHEDDDAGAGAGAWIYEVKLLEASGDVLKLEYDAATLDLLSQRGRYRGERHEDDD